MGPRLYAIGDVHGQRDMLRQAHARIAADRQRCGDPDAPLVHLGDLCDRGPDTAGVIADILDGLADGRPWHVLRGNHDLIFSDFLEMEDAGDPRADRADFWLSPNMGGIETLASYGVLASRAQPLFDIQAEALAAIPADHRALLRDLPYLFETDDLLCVHAGIRPGVPIAAQDPEDLVWIRYEFLDDRRDHGKLVVHGHTPTRQPEHHGNRVNLDTGAGYGRPITAAVFEGRDGWVLTDRGRQPL